MKKYRSLVRSLWGDKYELVVSIEDGVDPHKAMAAQFPHLTVVELEPVKEYTNNVIRVDFRTKKRVPVPVA